MKNHGVKLLLTGLANSGKTNALRTLDPKKTLVINIDGKTFSLPLPHANYETFDSIEQFLYGGQSSETGEYVDGVADKINKFKEKTGDYPDVVVFDTVSRIFQVISDNCNTRYSGFETHSKIAKEIYEFNNFIQTQLIANGINVISTTHVTYDEKLGVYSDASTGQYKKAGGAIGSHDHVSFLQVKNKKYKIIHRSPGLPCRTLLPEDVLPSEQDADDYSLAKHLKLLKEMNSEVSEFII